jgi:putative ABC transport system substrate-binding protein
MRRRHFMAGLGSMAVGPVVARAQQGDRVRRIGVFIGRFESDPAWKRPLSEFTQALAGLGWTDGRNVRIDFRWGGSDINRMRALGQELVGMQPDIIVTLGSTAVTVAVQRETGTIPIVFASVADPVASGLVARLDRVGTSSASPHGNPRWEASGLNCSRRSRPGSSGPPSCSIRHQRSRIDFYALI